MDPRPAGAHSPSIRGYREALPSGGRRAAFAGRAASNLHGANMLTPMTPRASERSPDTIVLVHGFWVTPRSWEHWIPYYETKGYRVLAPAYPGFEVEVEALNADPTPVERITVPAIIAHLESIVGALDAPPILMGHSAGGTFVQI